MNKIEENRVAKEEISGCHKKCKTGQRTKNKRNGQTKLKEAQKLGQKEAKR